MTLLVLEHKNKCEFIKIAYLIMNSEEYQLNRIYMDKFYSLYKLIIRIMMICRKIVSYFAYILILIFTTIAYFDSEMNFSIIIMSIWFLVTVITFYYAILIFFTASAYIYLISLYMKYRFRQVLDIIEIYLKRGNTFQTI